jgi:hypothetical protein
MDSNNHNISKILNGDSIDFKVKSSLLMPLNKSMITMIFGLIFTTISCIIFFTSKCLFVNFIECEGSQGVIFVAIILLLAGLIGIFIAIKNMYSDGPLVIGTPHRLILIHKDKVESIQWKQFLGDISVTGSKDKGTITLKKKSGSYNTNEDGSRSFVPEMIYLVDIEKPYEIEAICCKRIQNL